MAKGALSGVSAPILLRAQQTLGMTQTQLGAIIGASRKTVARWQNHAQTFSPRQIHALASAVHPVDPDLAAEIAAFGGTTLETLGIVVPTPSQLPPAPTLAHLVDAVVMAAVEANGQLSPQIRPLLSAAFERAAAMGLSVTDVARGLRGDEKKRGK